MEALLGLVASVFVGTLVEYGLHRGIHHRFFRWAPPYRTHRAHHQTGNIQPLRSELTDYLAVAAICSPFGMLGGWMFFGGWVVGCFAYALLVSVVHHFSHQRNSAFHAFHHEYPKYNFGVATSIWDRAFKTYRKPEALALPEKTALGELIGAERPE